MLFYVFFFNYQFDRKKVSIHLYERKKNENGLPNHLLPYIYDTNGISPAAMDQSIHIGSPWLNHAQ